MFWIVTTRSWLISKLWLFSPSLSGAKLASVTSLNFVDEFIFHCISWLICTGSRLNSFFDTSQTREPLFILLFLYSFAFKYSLGNFLMILTRTYISSLRLFSSKPSTYHSKSVLTFGRVLFYSWLNIIWSRSWCSIFNVLVFTLVIRIISNLCWWRSFLRKHSALSWILWYPRLFSHYIRLIHLRVVNNGSFSLIHCSQSFACKLWGRFICV